MSGSTEILSALVQVGLKSVRLAGRAHALGQRGVTPNDILAVAKHLTSVEGHGPKHALALLDAALESAGDWSSLVQRARAGVRSSVAASPAEPLRAGRKPTNSAHETRIAEMTALGMPREEALRYDRGGYIHAGIVGDDRLPGDVAKENGLSTWDAVQLASGWAQRFNGGTTALRAALDRQRCRCRDFAKTERDQARRVELLDLAETLRELLEGVPPTKAKEA